MRFHIYQYILLIFFTCIVEVGFSNFSPIFCDSLKLSSQNVNQTIWDRWEDNSGIDVPFASILIGIGPNLNFPKGNDDIKTSTSFLPGYGVDIRFMMYLDKFFFSSGAGFYEKRYKINYSSVSQFPVGNLSRSVKGTNKLSQITTGFDFGTLITPRLNIYSGTQFSFNVTQTQKFDIEERFVSLTGDVILSTSEQDVKSNLTYDLLIDVGMCYYISDNVLINLNYSREVMQKKTVRQGGLINRNLQLLLAFGI